MKRQPMIVSSISAGAAAILALVTLEYVSESYVLLLAVLTYVFYSVLEDLLKLSKLVTRKFSQA